MRRNAHRLTQRATSWRTLVILLAVAAVAFVLPAAVTGRMANLLQIIAPLQDIVSRLTDWNDPAGLAGSEGGRAADRIEALRSTVATLAAQNQALRRENEMLAGVRGRGLGARGRLIPARIIAGDALAWRESKTLLAGRRAGVRRGDAVLSDRFSLDLGQTEGVSEGMAVVAAEALVGVIERCGSYTSQVGSLSDPDTRMAVTIARVDGSSVSTMDEVFWLVGQGGGRIEIRDVHHKYINGGAIRVGDMVMTLADDLTLPPNVTIGKIASIKVDPGNSLLYVLQVEPAVGLADLRRVFVVDEDE